MAERRDMRAVPEPSSSMDRGEMMTTGVAPMDRMAAAPAWYNRISLSSIVGGAFSALASWAILLLLGYAIGFGTAAVSTVADIRSIGTGVAIWVAFSGLIAFFIGGYVTSRFANIPLASDGLLHGFATWAFATIIGLPFVFLVLSGVFAFITNWVNVALGIPSTATVTPASIQNAATVTALVATFVVVASLINLIGSAFGGWLGSRRMTRARAMTAAERGRMAA